MKNVYQIMNVRIIHVVIKVYVDFIFLLKIIYQLIMHMYVKVDIQKMENVQKHQYHNIEDNHVHQIQNVYIKNQMMTIIITI